MGHGRFGWLMIESLLGGELGGGMGKRQPLGILADEFFPDGNLRFYAVQIFLEAGKCFRAVFSSGGDDDAGLANGDESQTMLELHGVRTMGGLHFTHDPLDHLQRHGQIRRVGNATDRRFCLGPADDAEKANFRSPRAVIEGGGDDWFVGDAEVDGRHGSGLKRRVP